LKVRMVSNLASFEIFSRFQFQSLLSKWVNLYRYTEDDVGYYLVCVATVEDKEHGGAVQFDSSLPIA
jgi:hypothetical protein